MVEAEGELETGITWRSLLSLVYAAVLLGPIDVFLALYMGSSFLTAGPGYVVAAPALYIFLILFTEISRMFGSPLKRHEVFIMYYLFGFATIETTFITLLQQGYYKSSPLAKELIEPFTGKRYYDVIPSWYAPSPSAYELRTFLHPEWLLPMGTFFLATILNLASEVGLGLLCAHLYIDVEKLPYPTAPVASEGILTVAERDPRKIRIFAFASFLSFAWSFLTFGIPSVMGGAFGVRVGFLTLIDLTPYLSQYMPGATFAVDFEPFPYTWGWMLSTSSVTFILIGSYAVWFFANWAIINFNIPSPLFAEFQREYYPSMTMDLLMWRSQLWIWTGFMMGAALGITVVTLIRGRRFLVRSLRSLTNLAAARHAGYLPLHMILALWLGGTVGATLLIYVLVPEFPLWTLILFSMLIPFVNAIINARGMGEVGYSVSIPYLRESMFLFSGYRGATIWFAPLYAGGYGTGAQAAGYTYMIKVAKVTGTKPMDYFKTLFLILPLTWFMSFIVVSTFLLMAPIPSNVFPMTMYLWPEQLIREVFMMRNFYSIYKLPLIGVGFILTAALTVISSYIPFLNVMGLFLGFSTAIPFANALFIGHIIGIKILKRWFGADWWDKYRGVVLAGVACGYGIIAAVGGASILISKALWHTQTTY